MSPIFPPKSSPGRNRKTGALTGMQDAVVRRYPVPEGALEADDSGGDSGG